MSNCSEERLRRWKANAAKQARADICTFSGDEEAWLQYKAEQLRKAREVRRMMKAGSKAPVTEERLQHLLERHKRLQYIREHEQK
ncbi:MAG: hypothetical protein ACOX65_01830 [Anaerotruncus rubiinfantis]|jgi:hypothetical protein